MSASLVGSEMCIRDRLTPFLISGGLSSQPSFPCNLMPRPWHPRNASQPVSYTHLTLPTICSV
eukprot:14380076-Alexandrium_andersonii.AAC.1